VTEHFYQSIGGWAAFAPIYFQAVREFPENTPGVFVEVGSWLGRSAALMGVEIENSKKPIRLFCVDPWVDGGPDLRHTDHFKKLKQPIYDQFLANTKPIEQHLIPLRMFSIDAAKQFADGSIDFLMLDGDHSYHAVKADIGAWLPKMKRGGIISGDDYGWPGVRDAANEAFGERNLNVEWIKRHTNYLLSKAYWSIRL
jgi:predicted O-methyltransferase YrrM